MKTVTLIFESHDGEITQVECARLTLSPASLRPGDHVADPNTGMLHVYEVRPYATNPAWTVVVGCDEHEHIYAPKQLLTVARPLVEFDG